MSSVLPAVDDVERCFDLRSRVLWSGALTLVILAPLLVTGDYIWGAGQDLPRQHQPLREYGYAALRAGEWPLWNPLIGNGLPYQTGFRTFAYPIHILGLFLAAGTVTKISVVIHTYLGIFSMTSVMNFLGFSRLGCLIAGLSFGGSGFVMGRLYAGHIDWYEPVAYAPLVLWTFLLAFRYRGMGWTLLCGATVGWMALAGHYQPIYLVLVAVLGLLGFLCLTGSRFACQTLTWKERWLTACSDSSPDKEPWILSDFERPWTERRRDLLGLFVRVALVGGVSVGMSLFRLLPSAQSAMHSNRLASPEAFGESTAPLSQFIGYFIPHFFEGTTAILCWSYWPSWETQGYLGVVLLVLVCLAWSADKEAWLAPTVLAGFGLVVSGGDSLGVYPLWQSFDPLLQNFSAPGRFALVTVIFASWLGALGMEVLTREQISTKSALQRALPVLLISGLLSAWLFNMTTDLPTWGRFVQPMTTPEAWNLMLSEQADNLSGVLSTNLRRSFLPLFLLLASLLCLAAKKPTRERLLVFLVLLDLCLFVRPYLKTAPPSSFELSPQLTQFLQTLPPGVRIYWSSELDMHNRLAAKGLSDISVSEYFLDRAYLRASSLQNGGPATEVGNVLAHGVGPLLDLQGAGVWLSPRPLQGPGLKELGRIEGLFVYQNLRALPRAFVAASLPQGGSREIIDLARTPEAFQDPSGKVELLSLGSNRVVLQATLERDGVVVLTDNPWPGWHVSVDGESRELLVLNAGLHRGVKVGAGTHEVVFSYWPKTLTIGLVVSSSVLGFLLWALVPWRRPSSPVDK